MSALDEIAANLPIDQLAAQLGEDPAAVSQAVSVAIPALLHGLEANAADPAGEASLAAALSQHDNDLAGGPVSLGAIDLADGEKIVGHIFGNNTDAVINQLGGVGGGSSSLIRKLIPFLAPIVLSYIAKQFGAKGGAAAGGGLLGGVLGQILSGAAQGAGSSSSSASAAGGGLGSILGDVLGGLLGGGRR